ncbi:MAG: 23S rRNA (guanosine(2251)-2'-O)-methyltransferase RlmB [Treponema sp.]|nr:23S rRNA (guanosine(2251)-2'-O)-methyltransferase RlmB [Treponema sp.]
MIKTGFHAIEEFIHANQGLNGAKIYYSKPGPRVKKILSIAEDAGLKTIQVDNKKLDEMVSSLAEELQDHRGIVLQTSYSEEKKSAQVDFDEWLKLHSQKIDSESEDSSSSNKICTVLVLDKITDPHNVGAILRSCDQFGVSLVIIPEHKSANDVEENQVIARSSAGASAWVPFCLVNNLVRAVQKLKEAGFWVFGADAGGTNCGKIDFPQKTVLVMGSEGKGISKLLEEQCDSIVSIPTCGKIDSLNVSVAAGVLLYELYRRQN